MALYDTLRALYSQRDQDIREMRELRFMQKKVFVPATYGASTTEIRTPIMNDLIQRLAGALSINTPRIYCPPYPKGNQDLAQRNSTLREKWTTAVLQELESQAGKRVFYQFMDHLVGDGYGVLKLIHRDEFWNNFPKLRMALTADGEETDEVAEDPKDYAERVFNFKAGNPLPFQLSAPDPLTVYFFKSDRGTEEVIEVNKRPRLYVAKRFNVGFDKKGNPVTKVGTGFDKDTTASLTGDVEYWEHWTPEYLAFFVNRKCVEVVWHGMGFIPLWEALGSETSAQEPEKAGLSVGYGLRHLLPALDSLLTMKTNNAFMQAYPSFKRTRVIGAARRAEEEGEDQDNADVEFEPGTIYDGMGGEDLEAIQIPPVGPDVNESIQMIMNLVDKAGVPSLLSGQNSPNRVSGAAYSEMLNVSRTKYTPIIRNASAVYIQMIQALWWYVENRVRDDIPVWGETGKDDAQGWLPLGPSDIDGYYKVDVTIEPLLPEDDIAQGQHALSMVQGRLWSKRYAREQKMGIQNPEEMEDEILVESAMDLPQLQMYLVMKALERADMDELKELFQMTTQMAEQQLQALAGQANAATGPGQEGLTNLAPGTGGAHMPGAGGMMNAGQTPTQPATEPVSIG